MAIVQRKGPETCTLCGGPMPAMKAMGPIPIYCANRCRKAAYEDRRLRKPDAFRVETVHTSTERTHDLNTCVDNALASPRAYRRMVEQLTAMIENGQFVDTKWDPVRASLDSLNRAIRK